MDHRSCRWVGRIHFRTVVLAFFSDFSWWRLSLWEWRLTRRESFGIFVSFTYNWVNSWAACFQRRRAVVLSYSNFTGRWIAKEGKIGVFGWWWSHWFWCFDNEVRKWKLVSYFALLRCAFGGANCFRTFLAVWQLRHFRKKNHWKTTTKWVPKALWKGCIFLTYNLGHFTYGSSFLFEKKTKPIFHRKPNSTVSKQDQANYRKQPRPTVRKEEPNC